MATAQFFAPGSEYELAQQEAQRNQAMAQQLRQQAATPIQGQQVGQYYAPPSWTQGLAKLLQGVNARDYDKQAAEGLRSARSQYDTRSQNQMQAFVDALGGTQARPEVQGNNPSGFVPAQEAQAPNPMAAAKMGMGSDNPMLQGAGVNILNGTVQQQMQQQRMAQILASMGGGQGAPQGAQPSAGGQMPSAGAPPMAGGMPPQAAPQGPQAPFPNLDKNTLIALLSGDPTMAKAAEMNMKAGEGIPLREGDLVVKNPDGTYKSMYQQPKMEAGMVPTRTPDGMVTGAQALPGYAQGMASIKGTAAQATEGAKAAQDMVTVDTPQGPKMMTRAQAVQQAGGQKAPDADRALIFKNEMTAAQGRLAGAKTPDEQARAQQDVASLTREMKAAGIPLQDEGARQFSKTVASQSAESLLANRDKARAASDDLQSISEARKAIKGGVYQGSGADFKLGVSKFINANVPGITVDPEKVGNTDYLKSTLGAGLLAQAKTLGTNPSNADAQRINDIVGSIGKDALAMQKILDWRESMANRSIQMHNATVDDAEKRGMQSPYDLRVKSGTPDDINALLKKYGGK